MNYLSTALVCLTVAQTPHVLANKREVSEPRDSPEGKNIKPMSVEREESPNPEVKERTDGPMGDQCILGSLGLRNLIKRAREVKQMNRMKTLQAQ